MNIISGKYKNLKISGYDVLGTRPTTNRIRESLIATISPFLQNATVLDLFAGTGSLGIEALSNGALSCTFVEINAKMIKELQKNLEKVTDDHQIIKTDFRKIKGKYDIIFLDPPYQSEYLNEALFTIKNEKLLNKNGIVVCEFQNEEVNILGFKIFKEKKYGDKKILILKNMEVE